MVVGIEENLLECFVVDKASAVLWDIQLPLLELFTELPGCQITMSGLLTTERLVAMKVTLARLDGLRYFRRT